MTSPGFQDRLARHLEGTLPPDEAGRLREELRSDPAARADLLDLQQLHHDLRRLLSPASDDEAFARGVLNAISGERKDSAVFARDVAVRARRGRPIRRGPSGWSAVPWIIAAGALVAFVGIVLLSTRDPVPAAAVRRPPPVEAPREATPVEERPALPPPVRREPAPPRTETPEKPKEPPPVPPPAVAREPGKPVPAPPAPVAKPAGDTRVEAEEVAVLETVEGLVRVGTDPARVGQKVGGAVATEGKESRAVLAFPDGTRVEIRSDSTVRAGSPLALDRGALVARVSPRPAGRPFVVATPHGQARVLGTVFQLALIREGTRLDVHEGKVRLTRAPDGASVDVPAGQFAVAGKGVALLTRAIPEEPKTITLDLEEFGTARGVKPADGMVRRPFLEPFDTAHGGWCVSVPGNGMEVTGDVRLAKGTWHLWVRHRDEPGNAKIGFGALLGDHALGAATTPGRTRDWVWKRFTFAWPGGNARITLRSTYEGVKAAPDRPDFRASPYGALNRWDRVCLTPDENHTPE